MSIITQLLFGWILAGIAAGYNPVTLTQNGVYIGPAGAHAAVSAHATRGK